MNKTVIEVLEKKVSALKTHEEMLQGFIERDKESLVDHESRLLKTQQEIADIEKALN